MRIQSVFSTKPDAIRCLFISLFSIPVLFSSCCMLPQASATGDKTCVPCRLLAKQKQVAPVDASNATAPALSQGEGAKTRTTVLPAPMPIKAANAVKAISTRLTAGPNLSFYRTKADFPGSTYKTKPGTGFQAGAALSLKFSDKFSFSPGLMLKHNKASDEVKYNNGTDQYSSTTDYQFTYLSLPLLAEIGLGKNLSLLAGPEVNFLMSAKEKSDEQTDNVKKSSVSTGLGVQAGMKLLFSEKSAFGLQVLYDYRISRLNKSESGYGGGGSTYEVPGTNMGSLQVGVVCEICRLLKGK